MLRYFKGTCEAIRAMHDYHAPVGSSSRANQSSSSRHAPSAPHDGGVVLCFARAGAGLLGAPRASIVLQVRAYARPACA